MRSPAASAKSAVLPCFRFHVTPRYGASSVFRDTQSAVSPSRQLSVGAGTEPLTANAIFGDPVKFTGAQIENSAGQGTADLSGAVSLKA